MDRRPHVLAIAYPAQGHSGPLMKLSQQIADRGIKVTFVCAESIRDLAFPEFSTNGEVQNRVNIISIDEGFEPGDEREESVKFMEAMSRAMPINFEKLIRNINSSDEERITCVLADATVSWALEIASKLGIKKAVFWPSHEVGLALGLHIQKLVWDGTIDQDGTILKLEKIQISQGLPAISASELLWNCPDNPIWQKSSFRYVLNAIEGVKISNWLLSNSFYELNPSAFEMIPNLLPVGPLLSNASKLGKPAVNFWQEDSSCLTWLDKQSDRSVIYIAFGSLAVLNQQHFEELALGLELTGLPFLWVVRSNLLNGSSIRYPDGFLERVANRGKIVKWAPQEKVLAHPSIACFLSHCGWNSTMEGLSMGLPFLCWPYFTDQFLNKSYVCNFWKVGLGLEKEESGIISRHQIQAKVQKLLCDSEIRANSMRLKEVAQKSIHDGGSSMKNFNFFIEQLKY